MSRILTQLVTSSLAVFSLAGCSFRVGTNPETANVNTAPASNAIESYAGTPASGGDQSAASAISALIADLYKQHDAEKGPFREKKRAVVDRFFAKPLADLIWKD